QRGADAVRRQRAAGRDGLEIEATGRGAGQYVQNFRLVRGQGLRTGRGGKEQVQILRKGVSGFLPAASEPQQAAVAGQVVEARRQVRLRPGRQDIRLPGACWGRVTEKFLQGFLQAFGVAGRRRHSVPGGQEQGQSLRRQGAEGRTRTPA